MKRVLLITLVLTFMLTGFSISQTYQSYDSQKEKVENAFKRKGELYFRFVVNSKDRVNDIGRHISVDNVFNKVFYFEVYAYASPEEMSYFSKQNIDFELLKHPGDGENIITTDDLKQIAAWDVYPTYPAYVTMMNNFATAYPNLCRIVNFGTTGQGRQMLCAVISDSVQFRKPKPRFMYSSSMHGDETTGYVLMLRLIDTLLSGNGNNATITNLVKNCEIWINPLANPDGTYHGGDASVSGAWRYNANSKDINRNFPDPVAGPNPTGTWAVETIAFMNLFNQFNFTLSMNFHGGAEVFNYPWDSKAAHHPDDAWFQNLGKRYVDTVHKYSPSTYLDDMLSTDPNIPGITNGYAWYVVAGGRQDYMTYFTGGREVTLEISGTKLLPQAQLPAHWTYNFKSFLMYMKESLNGIKGTVRDSLTNAPLKAKVYVVGVADTNWIYSDSICGDYHRMINAGTYSLLFTAPNYFPKTVTGITAVNDAAIELNVKLRPRVTSTSNEVTEVTNFNLYQNYPNPFNPVTNIDFDLKENSFVTLKIYDATGKEVKTLVNSRLNEGQHSYNWNAENFSSGVYFYKITAGSFSDIKKMLFIK
ncbi:MAG: M14 family zinc carboxypeptidase [Ignavibacteriae bacterium]|nr:M14 family zinc carboxypeptidase [Ignavibacteriota bacterium]